VHFLGTFHNNQYLTSAGPYQLSDYPTFGSPIPTRQWNDPNSKYKYGFNGMENDDDINVDGGSYDFGARIYDSKLGRFYSVDLLQSKLPFSSPYCFAINRPIRYIEIIGLYPGDPFETMDAAALDFALHYNDNSILEDVEYGAYIYKIRRNGETYYTYNIPTKSHTSQGVVIRRKGVPLFRRILAMVHTHGAGMRGRRDLNEFSVLDKENSKRFGIPNYVATPSGRLLKYNPKLDKVYEISNVVPSDPKDEIRSNNIDYNHKDLEKNEPFVTNSKLFNKLFENQILFDAYRPGQKIKEKKVFNNKNNDLKSISKINLYGIAQK